MSSKIKKSYILLKFLSLILSLSGIYGLFGAFSITGIGTKVFSFYKIIFGTYAWAGPFLSFAISVVVWPNAKSNQKKSMKSEDQYSNFRGRKQKKANKEYRSRKGNKQSYVQNSGFQSNSIPLPSTKLVSLKGFEKYFNSAQWVDETSSTTESIPELGKDFPTYFGEGQDFPFKIPPKLTSLYGLKEYFESVDEEIINESNQNANEISANDEIDPVRILNSVKPLSQSQKSEEKSKVPYAGQVAQLVNRANENIHKEFTSDGVTPLEREVLLGNKDFYKELEEHKKYQQYEQQSDHEQQEINQTKDDEKPELVLEKKTIDPNVSLDKGNHTSGLIEQEQEQEQEKEKEQEQDQEKETEKQQKQEEQEERKKDIGENSDWGLPPVNLLDALTEIPIIQEQETPKRLETVLQDFGVKAKVIRITKGPVITRYELAPAPGVKISKIVNLADDIALALAARDVRIEAPIPGKSAIGIEVPNKITRSVPFREVLETQEYLNRKSYLKLALGKDISDQPVVADLVKMPHLLVAGATGSGKSVCITALINSILFNATPDEVKFLLVDPKMVELNLYNGIPHLLAPVVTDPHKATAALKWVVKEMENRYQLFAANGVRDIERYNKLKMQENPGNKSALPFVIVVIDELADLMLVASGDVEEAICRLAQMARAAGIHLIIATQRPSVDVITGLIKANIPSRISFAVTSQIDSRTILDTTGAEKLLGKGDMLFSPQGINKPVRIQGCFVADEEVNRIIEYWKKQGKPAYLDPEHLFNTSAAKSEDNAGPDDELFLEAGQLLINSGMASVSFLQRKFKLGYARAARLMDMFEEHGVVGGYEGSKPRQILISIEEFNERFINK